MFPYRTRFRAYHGPANAKTSIAPASTVFTLVRLRQISIAVATSANTAKARNEDFFRSPAKSHDAVLNPDRRSGFLTNPARAARNRALSPMASQSFEIGRASCRERN